MPQRLQSGAHIAYKLRVHGFPIRWLTTIEEWDPTNPFVDVQTNRPYKPWRHTHRHWSENGGTSIEDNVRYSLPFGLLGRIVHRLPMVKRDVEAIFQYREQKMANFFR